ncbi:MAG: glycosyltransferase family 4 protein [Promethearchaeota archaeon]
MYKKLKICIVSPRIYSLFNNQCKVPYGGAEVQLYLLSKEFVKNEFIKLTIITGDYDLKKAKIEYHNNLLLYITQPLSKKFINFLKRPILLFLTLKNINPNIVIQRVGGIETGICAFYAKLFKKKFIFSIAHEYDVIKNGNIGISGFFYRYGLKNADFIVAQSKSQISKLESWRKKKINNIKVIKSGYSISNLDIKEKNNILWVGRAAKWKRPELFLKLAEKLPNEQFIIICNKSTDMAYWNKIFLESKVMENIEFIKYIPFNNIEDFFRKAKIFISTSLKEGFPNTFIQALKNRTPIISLNVDPDKFLTKNKIGFFCNDNFIEMVKNLKLLIENHELYENYSLNALLYVQKHHDISIIGNKWIKLILGINKS